MIVDAKMRATQMLLALFFFVRGCETSTLKVTEDGMFVYLLFGGAYTLEFHKSLVHPLIECLCTVGNCAFAFQFVDVDVYIVHEVFVRDSNAETTPRGIFTCSTPTFAYGLGMPEQIECRYTDPDSTDTSKTCYPYTTLRSNSTTCPCINIWWIEENPSCSEISVPEAVPCEASRSPTVEPSQAEDILQTRIALSPTVSTHSLMATFSLLTSLSEIPDSTSLVSLTTGYAHDEATSKRAESTSLLAKTDGDHSSTPTLSFLTAAASQYLPSTSPLELLNPTPTADFLYESTSISTSEDTVNSDDQTPDVSVEKRGESKENNSSVTIAQGVGWALAAISSAAVVVLFMKAKKDGNTANNNQLSSAPAGIETQPNSSGGSRLIKDGGHFTK